MFFLLKIYSCHEMRSMSNSFKAFKTRLPLCWSLCFGFWDILPCVLSHIEIRLCYCCILSLGWLWLRCVNHLQEFGEVSGATQTISWQDHETVSSLRTSEVCSFVMSSASLSSSSPVTCVTFIPNASCLSWERGCRSGWELGKNLAAPRCPTVFFFFLI